MPKATLKGFWRSFSGLGLLLGSLLFAASLTPSLIPRAFLLQGVLSGLCFAFGYGVGVFALRLWDYLEFPRPRMRFRQLATWGAAAIATVIVASYLWYAADWQNSIRARMEMSPVDTAHPLEVGLVAAVVAGALILLGRLLSGTLRIISGLTARIAPQRVSLVVGFAVTATLFALIVNGVIFRVGLRVADYSFRAVDSLIEPEIMLPSDPNKTGSVASLVGWEDLGRAGRGFVSSGPSRADITAISWEKCAGANPRICWIELG